MNPHQDYANFDIEKDIWDIIESDEIDLYVLDSGVDSSANDERISYKKYPFLSLTFTWKILHLK